MSNEFRPWMPLFIPPRLSGRTLDILLPALTALDLDYLQENPRTPMLYESGVRYLAEQIGDEKWLTVPFVLACMAGDCEDLACWRAAELQLRGEPAVAVWSVSRSTPDGDLYHICVKRADGRIEDPSALLGMGWEAKYTEKYGPIHGITDPVEPWKPVKAFMPPREVHRTLAALRAGTLKVA